MHDLLHPNLHLVEASLEVLYVSDGLCERCAHDLAANGLPVRRRATLVEDAEKNPQ
jgi:hypothetical protein